MAVSDESISLEETNRIRVSLGLKPIPMPGASSTPQSDDLSLDETNKLRLSLGLKPIEKKVVELSVDTHQKGQQSKGKDAELKESISLMKSKLSRKKRVNIGKALLDGDEEEEDWLSKIGTKSKAIKKKRNTAAELDSSSLKGVKVTHSLEAMSTLDNAILTLKDTDILDDEDRLESEALVSQKRVEKELERKLGKSKYTDEGRERTRLDLMQEDDQEEGFTLDGNVIEVAVSPKEDDIMEDKANKMLFHLTDEEQEVQDDYAKAKPVKMKKLNKKSKQQRKRDRTDEDGDFILRTVELMNEDNFQDDDELRKQLSRKRLEKQKRLKLKPEELAREIQEENENKMDVERQGVIIDENAEFLSSVKAELLGTPVKPEGGVIDKQKDESIEDEPIEDEPIADEPMENEAPCAELSQQGADKDDIETAHSGPDFSGGLASTLCFLQSKNVFKMKSAEQLEQEREHKKLKQEMALRSFTTDGEKPVQDSSVTARLANYNPEINIKYHDEYGRELTAKESYKQLSHQFHGKTPNKSKIAKKKKQVDEERRKQYSERLLDEENKANSGLRIQ
jgi:U4/U6.U5 tri-snRNP-associated protein 1